MALLAFGGYTPRVMQVFWILLLCARAYSAGVEDARQRSFPSSVPGITIRNTHAVDTEGRVLRGQEPRGKAGELAAAGVTDVLIFKEENKNEVQKEIEALAELGISGRHVLHIPVQWKEAVAFQEACGQVLEGLSFMVKVSRRPAGKVFFHCTSGEDRTGMLAGLYRMLTQGWDARRTFEQEMCARGYEAGDPKKPYPMAALVRQNLTPHFLRLAWLIETRALTDEKLDKAVCRKDPAESLNFRNSPHSSAEGFRCRRPSGD